MDPISQRSRIWVDLLICVTLLLQQQKVSFYVLFDQSSVMKPIICFSPLLLLRFYLSPELLQSEKMIYHYDCDDEDDHVDDDNEDDASMMMMMMIGNLANINLATIDCIQSSDLLGEMIFP